MDKPKDLVNQPTQIGIKSPIIDSSKTSRFDISDKKALSLHCYFQVNEKWQHKQFSHMTKTVKIGPSSFDNEIGISDNDVDKVQVIISRVEDSWYVMESGKNDLMQVNGVPKRQVVLKKKQTCALQVGKSVVVICLTEKSKEAPKLHKAPPAENEFALIFNDSDQYSFSVDIPCLIGSNPFCAFFSGSKDFLKTISSESDIAIFETPFLGIIYRIGKRLFIHGFNEEVKVDNQPVMEPVMLSSESNLSIGKTILKIMLPPAVSGKETVLIPKQKEAIFALLPLDDPEGNFPELHIPSSARSLTLGRSSQQSDISINDINISRQHAQFIIYPKNMMVYDCGSSNGTFVNGEKITKKTVKPGDTISLGDIPFFFCYAKTE